MKRTLLSVSVALACTVSAQSFAAGASDDSLTFWDEAQQFGGHIGGSYEYEDKKTTLYSGTVDKIKTKTAEVLSLAYSNSIWDFSAYYGYKLTESRRDSTWPGGSFGIYTWPGGSNWAETKGDGHILTLTKGFNLGGGWSAGLLYGLEYSAAEVDPSDNDSYDTWSRQHTIKPYVNYWSNPFLAGFEFGVELLNSEVDNGALTESDGYSVIFKPYKRLGNWELGVEFYYQQKDSEMPTSDGTDNYLAKTDFTEKYFEPIVQYSFEDAGTLYVRTRIGEKETKTDNFKNGAAVGSATYLADVRKGTIGYQQLITQDWEVKAQYEFADETETTSSNPGKEQKTEQDKFYASALYRF